MSLRQASLLTKLSHKVSDNSSVRCQSCLYQKFCGSWGPVLFNCWLLWLQPPAQKLQWVTFPSRHTWFHSFIFSSYTHFASAFSYLWTLWMHAWKYDTPISSTLIVQACWKGTQSILFILELWTLNGPLWVSLCKCNHFECMIIIFWHFSNMWANFSSNRVILL